MVPEVFLRPRMLQICLKEVGDSDFRFDFIQQGRLTENRSAVAFRQPGRRPSSGSFYWTAFGPSDRNGTHGE